MSSGASDRPPLPGAAAEQDGLPTREWLAALPKADLHLHLVGSAAPATVTALAANHPGAGVPSDLGELTDFYLFRGFAHFLDVYTAVSSLVRDPDDLLVLVDGLGTDLHRQGVVYAEVTVTPTTHQHTGIAAGELAEALTTGAARVRARTGVELRWVYDSSGGDGPGGAEATLRTALEHPPVGLVGFGVGGAEAGAPRAVLADVFARARAHGLASVPHAGETTGPDEVWAAVDDLGARRVGHGIAAAADPDLLTRLRDLGVVLEVCLSSNVATGAVARLEDHPLPVLLAAGVPVVLGSDDPPMFGTDLLREYQRAHALLEHDDRRIVELAAASLRHALDPGAARAAARQPRTP